VIPSDLRHLEGDVAQITAAIDRTACWAETETIGLAMREPLVNAMVHGNHFDPAKAVRLSVSVNENCALLTVVKDAGSGFDPSKIPDPTASEPFRRSRQAHLPDETVHGFR
jgi:anti-sigma regulatory factor (Ser/Thr protein kinase)